MKHITRNVIIFFTLTAALFLIFSVYLNFPAKLMVEDYSDYECPIMEYTRSDGTVGQWQPSCLDVGTKLSISNLISGIVLWIFISFIATIIISKIKNINSKSDP